MNAIDIKPGKMPESQISYQPISNWLVHCRGVKIERAAYDILKISIDGQLLMYLDWYARYSVSGVIAALNVELTRKGMTSLNFTEQNILKHKCPVLFMGTDL